MTDDSHVIAMRHQAASYESNAHEVEYDNALDAARPSMRFRPRLSIDGDQWCALYGDNLQDGVAGFGKSPEAAYLDFDREWVKGLPARTTASKEKDR